MTKYRAGDLLRTSNPGASVFPHSGECGKSIGNLKHSSVVIFLSSMRSLIAGQQLTEFYVLTAYGVGWIVDNTLVKRVLQRPDDV